MPKSVFLLATPTVELVKVLCDEFDTNAEMTEKALGQLWAQFPRNAEASHVLLKVVALNKLYSTRVLDIYREILARHIAGLGLDPLLADRSLIAVDRIAQCGKLP